jgi:hypothetical protein
VLRPPPDGDWEFFTRSPLKPRGEAQSWRGVLDIAGGLAGLVINQRKAHLTVRQPLQTGVVRRSLSVVGVVTEENVSWVTN